MRKIDLFVGVVIGFIATIIGSFFFIMFFTDYSFIDGLYMMRSQKLLGKIITLGAILNIIFFFVLLKFNKDLMARGVVLATIILTVVTLFL